MVTFTLDEHVAILQMDSGENRFNPTFLQALLDTLDQIENTTEARTLIVTSGHAKIFSNGIDLDWLAPVIQKNDLTRSKGFFYQLNSLFRRLVTYPLVTIAAISGHAFAGGAILTCAFDFRLMRSDRGFFCLPEVDLGIPFLPGMNALLKKAIPLPKLIDLEFTGRRLTAEECLAYQIVLNACPEAQLLPEALAFAKTLKKDRRVITEMKLRLYKDILNCLDVEDIPYIESGQFNIPL